MANVPVFTQDIIFYPTYRAMMALAGVAFKPFLGAWMRLESRRECYATAMEMRMILIDDGLLMQDGGIFERMTADDGVSYSFPEWCKAADVDKPTDNDVFFWMAGVIPSEAY